MRTFFRLRNMKGYNLKQKYLGKEFWQTLGRESSEGCFEENHGWMAD